jgi:hypothetical protein
MATNREMIDKKNSSITSTRVDQPLFTLYQAWYIKGCLCAWGSFAHNRFLQPKGGFYDGGFGGIGVFTNETIIEWLPLTDEDLEDYHRKYKTGAKPRSKIRKRKKLTSA